MRGRRVVGAVLAVALLASGCSLDLQDVPMPSLVHGPTREVEAVFDSALNLPLQAPVKMDGATVGQVDDVEVRDYAAHVTMRVLDSAALHRGASAEIRLTSPMGTAFVELTDGRGPALADGAVIPLARTEQAPDVSDLLSALSVVVTGGSFADIKTIIDELNTALTGHTGDVRRLLGRLDTSLRSLNAHTAEIDRSLSGLHRLTRELAQDSPLLARAVTRISPAVRALAHQRRSMMALLAQVRRFGDTSARVIAASRADLVSQLRDLDPVLSSLIRTQDRLVPIMNGILRFGAKTDLASPGDYSNFDLTFLIDPGALVPEPDDPHPPGPDDGGFPGTPDLPGLPGGSGLPDLATLLGLRSETHSWRHGGTS